MYAHILSVLVLGVVFNQISLGTGCQSAKTCGECIGYATERCIWCAASRETFKEVRCQPETLIHENKTWCHGFVNNPKSNITIVKAEEFRKGTDKVDAIQLKPQKIQIKVRPGVPVTVSFNYKPDKDYPLDVYYLMDFSFTMLEHFDKLKSHFRKIYRKLATFTNNVRLGLGSFVDKPGFPYADSVKHNSYIFKNHINLTKDMADLESKVEKVKHDRTANYDDPEAILDALMQAIVCKEVQWRDVGTRIIVTSTDGTYHSAGDGKMVGAVIPNDMMCHYDRKSALLYDYPSVSQMNKIAHDKQVKIIFAVLAEVKKIYEALSRDIFSSESVELNTDTNIVDLITNAYLNTRNKLKLYSYLPENITVKFDPPCDKIDCDIEHKGNTTVDVILTAMSCSSPQTVRIGIQGQNEHLEIEVIADCQCDCEKDGEGIPNSKNCESQGLEQCGVCTKCNKNRYGEFCKCNASNTKKDLHKCMTGNTDSCSKRGECICGSCQCYDGYHGDLCQYDGKECSPPGHPQCFGHGECREAKCKCHKGWDIKEDCSCSSDNGDCMNPISGEVCTGNGICECNQCKCNTTSPDVKYSGKYCECVDRGCDALNKYVVCIFNKHNKTDCAKEYKEHADIDFVNRTELNSQEWQTATFCKPELSNGSLVVFRYHCRSFGKTQKMHVIIQDEADTPGKASIWIPLSCTIAAILLIGLLTILAWKFLVDMYDAREYKKFEKESKDAGFDVNVNPHYKEPQMKFSNPTFNSHCD